MSSSSHVAVLAGLGLLAAGLLWETSRPARRERQDVETLVECGIRATSDRGAWPEGSRSNPPAPPRREALAETTESSTTDRATTDYAGPALRLVEGTVLFAGVPAEDLALEFVSVAAEEKVESWDITAADGGFAVRLPPGSYRVQEGDREQVLGRLHVPADGPLTHCTVHLASPPGGAVKADSAR